MSHYMTALAMRQVGLKPSAKVVLYWIADHHNGETGQCNPSIARIAFCSEMSRRSVEAQIFSLAQAGLISVTPCYRNQGGKTSNSYTLSLAEIDAQNLRIPPAKSAHGDAQNLRMKNLGIYNLGNEQEPPLPPKGGRNEANEISKTLCAWASPDAVTSFIAYRKRTKAKALTLTAAKRLATCLQEIFNAGGDTDDALGLAEERGWQSVKPEWYFNDKQRSDRGSNRPGSGMAAAFAAVAARSTPRQS